MPSNAKTMTDGEFVAYLGTDAAKWAEEFAAITDAGMPLDCVYDPSPGNLVHAWFANAIGAGRSAGYAEAQREHNPNWPLEAEENPKP